MTAAADSLDDEIHAVFPDATEVEDDGPWTTICEARFGALQDRYVPLHDGTTPADGSRRRNVTAAEPA